MKVGILSQLCNPGGVQSCVLSLTEALNSKGVTPTLLSDRSPDWNFVRDAGVDIDHKEIRYSIHRSLAERITPLTRGAGDFFYFFKTSWLTEAYDFLYIFHPNIIVDENQRHLYYLSMSPLAVGAYGNKWLSSSKYIVYQTLIRHLLPVYDYKAAHRNCVINSEFTKSLFTNTFERDIAVVYPPVRLVSRSTCQRDKTAIVFFSRIAPTKRPNKLLELADAYREEAFIIMGAAEDSAYLGYLKTEVERLQLTNISIHPNPDNEFIEEALVKAKIYVFPALKEHFGISTVEAMSFGALPFVHDSGGQREIVPWPELRFSDLNYVQKFDFVLNLSDEEAQSYLDQMDDHIAQFDEGRFQKEMLSYMGQ